MAKKGGPPTKSEILNQIAKDTSLSRKNVSAMFDSLNGVIKKSLRSHGLFTLRFGQRHIDIALAQLAKGFVPRMVGQGDIIL